ncbi:MAG: hypothetical protein CMP59_00645 [Flavobacteriales bacterium]|nr:hypothetical protein [Flavobacteriales bacterium]|tara:strand:+ start:990 stop:1298 length:309 start_codon:yes stop_codon:yes gene_type:complete
MKTLSTFLLIFLSTFNLVGAGTGESCKDAIELVIGSAEDYTFPEEVQQFYLYFNTGSNDSIQIEITEPGSGSFIELNEVNVYEYEECGSLTLVFSTSLLLKL